MGMETSPTTSDLNKSLASTTLVQWPVKRSPFFRITTSARAGTAITSTIGIKENLGLMRASRPKLGLGSIVHGEQIATAFGGLGGWFGLILRNHDQPVPIHPGIGPRQFMGRAV